MNYYKRVHFTDLQYIEAMTYIPLAISSCYCFGDFGYSSHHAGEVADSTYFVAAGQTLLLDKNIFTEKC